MSPDSSPPSRVKNFSPLRFQGRWLAVTITAPSQPKPGRTVDINMAGVLAMAQSRQEAPSRRTPSAALAASSGPESRESRPTPTVSFPGAFPFFFPSQRVKARVITPAFSGEAITLSPEKDRKSVV